MTEITRLRQIGRGALVIILPIFTLFASEGEDRLQISAGYTNRAYDCKWPFPLRFFDGLLMFFLFVYAQDVSELPGSAVLPRGSLWCQSTRFMLGNGNFERIGLISQLSRSERRPLLPDVRTSYSFFHPFT